MATEATTTTTIPEGCVCLSVRAAKRSSVLILVASLVLLIIVMASPDAVNKRHHLLFGMLSICNFLCFVFCGAQAMQFSPPLHIILPNNDEEDGITIEQRGGWTMHQYTRFFGTCLFGLLVITVCTLSLLSSG